MGLLVAVATPVLVGGLLLAIPVHLVFSLQFAPWPHGKVTVHWLFGLVQYQVHSQPGRFLRRPSRRQYRGLKLALRHRHNTAALIWRLMKQLRRSVKLDDLQLHLRVGTGDPAETAWLVGCFMPLRFSLAAAQRLQIEADFEEPIFQGSCQGRLCVVPLRLLLAGLIVLCSPAFLRLLQTLLTRR